MRAWLLGLLLTMTVLAGCADAPAPVTDDPDIIVTETTGGVRGVVVDEAIMPLAGVTVLISAGETVVTDESGDFTFSGLQPSTYFIMVSRAGYQEVQSQFSIQAGKITEGVRVMLPRLPGVDPFSDPKTFSGFYECAFALKFITDSCDFVVRTAYDAGAPGIPRGVQNNLNTAYYYMGSTETAIVQEGFFDTTSVPNFRFSVASAPIDNTCDCSDTVYLEHISDSGYSYGRLDKDVTAWPALEHDYVVRGFIPFQAEYTDAAYAFNVEFQIITTVFHNWVPAEGWNFADRDLYPAP